MLYRDVAADSDDFVDVDASLNVQHVVTCRRAVQRHVSGEPEACPPTSSVDARCCELVRTMRPFAVRSSTFMSTS